MYISAYYVWNFGALWLNAYTNQAGFSYEGYHRGQLGLLLDHDGKGDLPRGKFPAVSDETAYTFENVRLKSA